jgi:fibronectin-binding autotransporter adhesin
VRARCLAIGASSFGGTVVLHGNNTYAGGTTISNGVTLGVFQDDNLGAAAGAIALSGGGELLTDSTASGGFTTSRPISLSGSTILAAATGTTATDGGVISGIGGLKVGDLKNAGTVIFSAANTYASGTTVVAGSLNIDNTSGSGSGSGPVNVGSGATLGGTGVINPSSVANGVAVNIASGAILSPSDGDGGASHLTIALPLKTTMDMDMGSEAVFDLGASLATSDEVLITGGTLTLNGQNFSNFTFNAETGFGAGIYTLFDSAGGITGSLGSQTTGTVDGYNATLELTDSNQELQLQIMAVPEPSPWAALVGVFGFLALMRRRR